MSNTNNTMQTQTSNTLHNAIMEAGGKDRPSMLALGIYVQWRSRIKRYIDTKPNHELIHYCLKNPPYKFTWADKEVPITEGSSVTTTERYMENYKNVSQDIRDQLNAEAEAFQIILTGIDNDIYSRVDACPNACEMWKAIKRFYKMMNELVRNQCDVTNHQVNVRFLLQLQPEWQRFVTLVKQSQELKTVSYHKLYDILKQQQNEVNEIRAERLAPRSQQAATRNSGKAIVNSPPPTFDQEPFMVAEDDEMIGNVVGAMETVEQADWKDDTDDESEDQELEAHYMYMAQIQEVTPDAADNSGPIYDSEPLQKVSNDDSYNVFAIESKHHEQSKSVNDTYPIEQDEHNVIIDSLDMSYDREQINQDDDDDLANERELLAFLIEKLKCEIDDSKNRNKFLETSNKVLVDKLKGEIEDFKNKNKSLESSNNRYKKANNKLSETNELMYNDLKKFQAELDRELLAHQETISILSQAKEAQIKLYKTHEDKELDKVIALENKVKVLDNIVHKTGQSVQTMNMLNRNCKTSFAKPKFFKKAQRANPRLYDIGMYKLHTEPTQTRTTQLPHVFRKTNKRVSFSTRVIPTTSVSRPQLKSNQIEDRVMLNNSQGKKQKVEDHRRNVEFSKNKTVVTACNDSLKAKTSNVNCVCATCGKCMLNVKHDMFVLRSLNGVNSRTKMPIVVLVSTREPKRTVNKSVAKPLKRTSTPPGYKWKPKSQIGNVNPNVSMPLGNASRTANILEPMTLRRSTVSNTTFNDQIAHILGYGDLVQEAVTIKRVYYVEGLNHNLFSVSQFCDADLEVAFWKSTCYIRDLKGNDLLTGSRETDLYSITLQDTTSINPICLMAKASSSQAWLWHRRLSHLNFDTINLISRNDIVIGLPKLKFVKDHICSYCELGKAKRNSFQSKTISSSKRQLQLLHMDLCGPMRVESINGKKYILVIVDDYSRYTWTRFLRSKDELEPDNHRNPLKRFRPNSDINITTSPSSSSPLSPLPPLPHHHGHTISTPQPPSPTDHITIISILTSSSQQLHHRISSTLPSSPPSPSSSTSPQPPSSSHHLATATATLVPPSSTPP
nr:hypothetical protein [Tanacetum cinerariifolium]